MNIQQRLFYLKAPKISERAFRRKQDPKYIQMESRNRHFEERKRYSIFSNDRYTKKVEQAESVRSCIDKLLQEKRGLTQVKKNELGL